MSYIPPEHRPILIAGVLFPLAATGGSSLFNLSTTNSCDCSSPYMAIASIAIGIFAQFLNNPTSHLGRFIACLGLSKLVFASQGSTVCLIESIAHYTLAATALQYILTTLASPFDPDMEEPLSSTIAVSGA